MLQSLVKYSIDIRPNMLWRALTTVAWCDTCMFASTVQPYSADTVPPDILQLDRLPTGAANQIENTLVSRH